MNMKKILLTIGLVFGIFMSGMAAASAVETGSTIYLNAPSNGPDLVDGCHAIFNENVSYGVKLINETTISYGIQNVTYFDFEVLNGTDFYVEIDHVYSDGKIVKWDSDCPTDGRHKPKGLFTLDGAKVAKIHGHTCRLTYNQKVSHGVELVSSHVALEDGELCRYFDFKIIDKYNFRAQIDYVGDGISQKYLEVAWERP